MAAEWGPWKTRRGMLRDQSMKNKRMTTNMAAWDAHPGRYDMLMRDDRRTEAGDIHRARKPKRKAVVPPLNLGPALANLVKTAGTTRKKPKPLPRPKKAPAGIIGALQNLVKPFLVPKEEAMDLEEVASAAPLPSNPPVRKVPRIAKRVAAVVADAMEVDEAPVVVVNRRPPKGIRNLPAEAIELLRTAAREGEGRELFGRGKKIPYAGEREPEAERATKRAKKSPREMKEVKQEVKQETVNKDNEFRRMINAWQNNEHRDAVAIWRSFSKQERIEIRQAMLHPDAPGRLIQSVHEISKASKEFFD